MPSTISKTKRKHKWQFEAIGTKWLVETTVPIEDLKNGIIERIEKFDAVYSRFREDSTVSAVGLRPGVYDFPADASELINFYRDLYEATDGAVSPLVGGVLDAAGYDKEYSLKPRVVSKAPEWDEAMRWNGSSVITSQPVILDFGAAGKGYLVDIVADMIEKSGVKEYAIDASGDMRIRGEQEVVGLENPYDPQSVIGTMTLSDGSLCASATNRRTWGDWHHIVDPRIATPTQEVVATWVIASTTMLADGLATALFFVSGDTLRRWEFQYVRLLADGTVERSDDFVGELYV